MDDTEQLITVMMMKNRVKVTRFFLRVNFTFGDDFGKMVVDKDFVGGFFL